MATANAQIGIAVAAYYPTLTLSADGGLETSVFKKLLSFSSRFWSVGPSLSETLYDAGLRRAAVQQFTAVYNADVAGYRQTVLTAFQQVEDSLATERILSTQIRQQLEAEQSAEILGAGQSALLYRRRSISQRACGANHAALRAATAGYSPHPSDDRLGTVNRSSWRRMGPLATSHSRASLRKGLAA